MKKDEFIQVEYFNGVAEIWLNRPDLRNALNKKMIQELISCLQKLQNDKNTRIVILRGRGNTFCSGADVKWMLESAKSGKSANYKDSKILAACFSTIYKFPKPVIAVVNGAVIGGGVGLMAGCDIVIAEEHTFFQLPEVRIGILPATILPYVLRRLGMQKTRLLTYLAQKVNTHTAMEMGLIDMVFPQTDVDSAISKVINNLLKASPNTLMELKYLIGIDWLNELEKKNIKNTVKVLSRVKSSKDGKEGMAAYMEKRDPSWVKQLPDKNSLTR